MKVSANSLTLEGLSELQKVLIELELIGEVNLKEPVLDLSGKILVKEGQPIKQPILDKLEEVEDQMNPSIQLIINKPLLNGIKIYLTRQMMRVLNKQENSFIQHLFDNTTGNYKNFIANSFRDKTLTLIAYKMYNSKYAFFEHTSQLGLLALGLLMLKPQRIRMIHVNTFSVAFCADLALAESNEWMIPPADDQARRKRYNACADFMENLSLPDGCGNIIRDHIMEADPAWQARESEDKTQEAASQKIDEQLKTETAQDTPQAPPAPSAPAAPAVDPAAIAAEALNDNIELMDSDDDNAEAMLPLEETAIAYITDIMKIARYISETASKVSDKEHFAEELVYMLAYNSSRGYFSRALIEPIVANFKQFEAAARILMRIGEIENKCIHPPSAWAYPKPRAGQILCKDSIYDCPNIVTGWDIHVVSPQEAYGWVGIALNAGNYPKCQLEEELKNVTAQKSTKK